MIWLPRLLLLLLSAAFAAPASAHPHVWVTARAQVIYVDGKITGIRHAWTFDKSYSSYLTQGLDADGDGKVSAQELQPLAKENTDSLVDFDYFTMLKAEGKRAAFENPQEAAMAFDNGEITLTFFLPVKTPLLARTLSLEVYDPTYFVAFSLAAGEDAVGLDGAPQGCAKTVTRAQSQDAAAQQNLSESFFESLTASSSFGQQFSNRAVIACP